MCGRTERGRAVRVGRSWWSRGGLLVGRGSPPRPPAPAERGHPPSPRGDSPSRRGGTRRGPGPRRRAGRRRAPGPRAWWWSGGARPDAGAPRRRRAPTPRGRGTAHADVAFWRSSSRGGTRGRAWLSIRPGALEPEAEQSDLSCRALAVRPRNGPPVLWGVLRDRSPEQKATLLLRRHHCSTTASRPRGRKPPAGSTSHPAGRRVRASARPPPAARPAAPRSHHGGGRRGGSSLPLASPRAPHPPDSARRG